MSFKKYLISATSSVVVLSVPVSAMEQGVKIDYLFSTNNEVPVKVNSSHSDNDKPKLRNLAQKAADKAGFKVNLGGSELKSGGFGTSCLTDSIVVKISQGECLFSNSLESNRLQTITNKLKSNPSKGIDFCLPTHIFKIYIDYEDKRNNVGYNIQITPRIKPQGDMVTMLKNSLNGKEKDLKTVRSFGEKFGMFQMWGLKTNNYGHDLTFIHKDMNPNNIMLMSLANDGSNATFKFIDIADCDDAKTSKGGSLVTDLTYFIHKTLQGSYADTNNITRFLENLYIGYVPQFQKDTCKKLRDSFYKYALMGGYYGLEGDNGCYGQMQKDIDYIVGKKAGVSKIQSEAFTKAYNLTFPVGPVKQPEPVYKKPEPVFKKPEPVYKKPEPAYINPNRFNAFVYIHMNGDLVHCTKDMTPDKKKSWALDHYIKWGSKEEFRFHFPLGIFYISKYKDLYELYKNLPIEQKEREGRNHYKLWGSRPIEKRDFSFPTDFNGLAYINAFGDLKSHFSEYKNDEERAAQGLLHYVTYGYYEMNIAGTRQTLYNPKVNLYKK